jgi:hypothetical protein
MFFITCLKVVHFEKVSFLLNSQESSRRYHSGLQTVQAKKEPLGEGAEIGRMGDKGKDLGDLFRGSLLISCLAFKFFHQCHRMR